jgi:DNA repair exonuclease SbcCD ATPase subunit
MTTENENEIEIKITELEQEYKKYDSFKWQGSLTELVERENEKKRIRQEIDNLINKVVIEEKKPKQEKSKSFDKLIKEEINQKIKTIQELIKSEKKVKPKSIDQLIKEEIENKVKEGIEKYKQSIKKDNYKSKIDELIDQHKSELEQIRNYIKEVHKEFYYSNNRTLSDIEKKIDSMTGKVRLKYGKLQIVEPEQIKELILQGKTKNEIAEHFNRTTIYISNVMTKNGLLMSDYISKK